MSSRNFKSPSTYQGAMESFIGSELFVAVLSFSVFLAVLPLGFSMVYGTTDFIEYFGALECLKRHLNPYDPANQALVQRELGLPLSFPVMMWNPPWLLLWMSPILSINFISAAQMWFLLQIVCIGASAIAITDRKLSYSVAAFALLFIPINRSLSTGQLGGFLCLLSTLLYVSLQQRRWFLSGMILSVCSVKPHLFLLTGMIICWWAVRSRKLLLLTGLALGLLLQIGTVILIWGTEPLQFWYTAIGSDPAGVVSLKEWYGPTFPQAFRVFISATIFGNVIDPLYYVVTIPCLSFGIVWLSFFGGQTTSVSWKVAYPALSAMSVVMSPYGWTFDFLAMYPFVYFCFYNRHDQPLPFIICFLATIGSSFHYFFGMNYEHEFWPWTIMLCFAATYYLLKVRSSDSAARGVNANGND